MGDPADGKRVNRAQLEHIVRAATQIADDDDLVIIGSQAILGQFPNAPEALLASMEVDVYPRNHPERADLIDGTIGELSPFHETFGYYAQGVGPSTARLPRGWEERLVPIRNAATRGATGWCLEAHDLVISKLIACREKDMAFARTALQHGLIRVEVLRERLAETAMDDERLRPILSARLDALAVHG
jgi:hypothetical protein